MEVYNYDYYINDMRKIIMMEKGGYSASYIFKLYGMSIVELEEEFRNVTGVSYCEFTGNKVKF